MTEHQKNLILRRLSKTTCFATVVLIYVGGLVTSTGSGLSVPDWPLSYGMLFPPMVGGVFYEHGHRMVATGVGFLMLGLAILTALYEKRTWVRTIAFIALGVVILQGLLGGLTVKLFLPTWVSVCHGVLAQTFLLITVFLAYSFSGERENRETRQQATDFEHLPSLLILMFGIYAQLIIGAIMRHSHAGLAIPDFPTMGGEWWPRFDQQMLNTINGTRFEMSLDPVTVGQVLIHLCHRIGALVLLGLLVMYNIKTYSTARHHHIIARTIHTLNWFFILQIVLGIGTVLTAKEYRLTSLHVVTGAVTLAWTFFLFLRTAPLDFQSTLNQIIRRK